MKHKKAKRVRPGERLVTVIDEVVYARPILAKSVSLGKGEVFLKVDGFIDEDEDSPMRGVPRWLVFDKNARLTTLKL